MRKLMIFCDGTWNSKNMVYTNVYRLYTLVKQMQDVVAEYYNGVGTGGGGVMADLLDGECANSLEDHIKSAYNFIVNRFQEGDEIMLFGFSRGAYTVRCVAGMIHNSGLVPNTDWTNEAYRRYRSRDPKDHPDSAQSVEFRDKLHCKNVEITFLGLWDTVGSAGIPIYVQDGLEYMGFYDNVISKKVRHASHALAIHEHMSLFEPCHALQNRSNSTTITEVWFPGEHLDVGGARGLGYRDISTMSLTWMIDQINRQTDLNITVCAAAYHAEWVFDKLLAWTHPLFDYVLLRWTSTRVPIAVRDRRITDYEINALYNKGLWDGLTVDILNKRFTSQTYNDFRRYMFAIKGVRLPTSSS